MKKWIFAMVSLGILGGGSYYWNFSRQRADITYIKEVVTISDITRSISATGTAEPKSKVDIKPPISGRLEKVQVREGQRVQKGQILAWMSSTERAAVIDASRTKGAEELKRWEDIYKPTPILSPISGTLIKQSVQEGQTVLSNEIMFVLSDYLVIKAKVDETDIARIQLKQNANITLDAYPNEPFEGMVNRIDFDSTTLNNVTSYGVEIALRRIPAFLKSGMTANVVFTLETKKQIPTLPTRFITSKENQSTVSVYNNEKTKSIIEKSIQVGITDGAVTEIVSGLTAGDTVLLVAPSANTGKSKPKNPFSPFGKR